MISAVFVTGRLGEKIAPLGRYVEIDRVLPGPTGHYGVDKVPFSRIPEKVAFL